MRMKWGPPKQCDDSICLSKMRCSMIGMDGANSRTVQKQVKNVRIGSFRIVFQRFEVLWRLYLQVFFLIVLKNEEGFEREREIREERISVDAEDDGVRLGRRKRTQTLQSKIGLNCLGVNFKYLERKERECKTG